MRIKNETSEPITIEPGDTIHVRKDKDTVRTMPKRIDIVTIKEVTNNGRK